MARQWLRKCSLIVGKQDGKGVELADPAQSGNELKIVFSVRHWMLESSTILRARIYNLSKSNPAVLLRKEFTSIWLSAGYDGNFGLIFQGTSIQTRVGRENPTDTYVDILARDGDLAHNYGVVNTTLAAGWTQKKAAEAVQKSVEDKGVTKVEAEVDDQLRSARGRAMFGMAKDHIRDIAQSQNATWNFNRGTLQILPQSAYKPGEIVVITAKTGMIGMPQQTQEGILVRCLLNPSIGSGTRIKLDNKSIQEFNFENTTWKGQAVPVNLSADGTYKVWFVDHVGDTRGNPWYTDIVALPIDPTPTQIYGSGVVTGVALPPHVEGLPPLP